MGEISLFHSKYQTRRLLIMRSMTLQMQLVRAIGRYLEGPDVSLPRLGTGITVEVHRLVGNFPEAQMLLRMLSRVSRASSGRCLSIW